MEWTGDEHKDCALNNLRSNIMVLTHNFIKQHLKDFTDQHEILTITFHKEHLVITAQGERIVEGGQNGIDLAPNVPLFVLLLVERYLKTRSMITKVN